MIRRLHEADIEDLITLRREALLAEPAAFTASPDADVGLDPSFLREAMGKPSVQGFFGAFADDLVGMAGVHRLQKQKEAHKAVLWGMYVRSARRGQGLGADLVSTAVEFAKMLPGVTHLHLSVSETARRALHLYENAGFVTWGIEEASLRVEGRSIAVQHMVLRLE